MILYRVLITLAAPILLGGAIWRWLRGREDRAALRDRLLGPTPKPGGLWLHGASNGELASARALIAALARPDRPLLVTANTVTGRALVSGWQLPHVTARIAPFDLRLPTARTLARVSGLILLENELWPNRVAVAAARGRPIVILGARMSAGSARTWGRFPGLARRLVSQPRLIVPQDPASADRLVGLGAAPERVATPFQLKSLFQAPPVPLPEDLRAAFPRDKTLLAASTHEGEETAVLDAFAAARDTIPDLRLILAPRHPARADDLERLVASRGFGLARRSRGEPPGPDIYLADTMGEMDLWYRLAGIAFVGGSLAPVGGHTPWEPAAHGCAILHGPHVANFETEYGALDTAGGAARVEDASAMAAQVLRHRTGSPMPGIARQVLTPGNAADVLARIESVFQTAAR